MNTGYCCLHKLRSNSTAQWKHSTHKCVSELFKRLKRARQTVLGLTNQNWAWHSSLHTCEDANNGELFIGHLGFLLCIWKSHSWRNCENWASSLPVCLFFQQAAGINFKMRIFIKTVTKLSVSTFFYLYYTQVYIRYNLLPSVFLFLRWRGNKCRCLIFNSL